LREESEREVSLLVVVDGLELALIAWSSEPSERRARSASLGGGCC